MAILFHTENLVFLDKICYPDLEIYENNFTFITGESGSGKSSLLRLFNGTALASSGEIYYKNADIKSLDILSHRREVMLVSQENFLIADTVRRNFEFFYEAREQAVISDEEIASALKTALIPVGIDDNATNFSGGEKQRLFLAIFLSFKPKVLLLDEPTSALDFSTSQKLFENLLDYSKKNEISLICVCHNDDLTNQFAEKIISL